MAKTCAHCRRRLGPLSLSGKRKYHPECRPTERGKLQMVPAHLQRRTYRETEAEIDAKFNAALARLRRQRLQRAS